MPIRKQGPAVIKRAFGLFLAAALCMTAVPAAFAEEEPATESAPAGKAAAVEGDSYYAYSQRYAEVPYAADPLVLEAGTAELKDGAERLTAYEGKEEAVRLENGGSAVWTFTVPADARYHLVLQYRALDGKGQNIPAEFAVDGETPFSGADSVTLKRVWKDATDIRQDGRGNDLIPKQEEVFAWQEASLKDLTAYMSEPFAVYLAAGTHTIELRLPEDGLVVSRLTLKGAEELPTYAEALRSYEEQGLQQVGDICLDYQAEATTLKSDRTIYPVYDRANASTVPNDPALIKRNIIGQSNWADSGMWISYTIDNVPKAGLYRLTLKYRQNTQLGMSVFRNIYINDEIPYAEMKNVRFPFGFGWQNLTVSDQEGTPCLVYLKEGKNTVSLEVTVGGWAEVLQAVGDVTVDMNTLYRRIIIVTSTNPDPYRDYSLEKEIRDLRETLEELRDRLSRLADQFDAINGKKSSQSEPLRRVAEQLGEFAKKPSVIPQRLSRFRENVAMISEWLLSNKQQPLELDYFLLHGETAKVPSPKGNFWENLVFGFKQFLAAFSDDYDSMADWDEGTTDVITVWTTEGRDQAQILKDLIGDRFTPETGIQVNLNLVQGGLVEATLSGNGPDVAIGVARGQPVNLASRRALTDLSRFEGFEDVMARFSDDAGLPYRYQGGTYALPLSQIYLVMFYRTDILAELGMNPPQTWTEVFDDAAILQRKNMTVGLPYTAITASGAIDLGVGAKDLFPTLLMQYGGRYYNEDLTATALDSAEALAAFKTWTSFYTKYGFDLSYDFNTRFRTGEMPIAIASYAMYGTLAAAAPEIRGQWAMTLVPGVEKEDGTIDRSGGASGSAAVLFKNAENQDACWTFLEWLTRTDVQADLANSVESLLGPAARSATANLEAFELLNWSREEARVIREQRTYVREVEELPGSYFTSRCLDNAFRDVLYNNRNPRVALEKENATINRELERKRIELGNG